jgi:hypothetical protein
MTHTIEELIDIRNRFIDFINDSEILVFIIPSDQNLTNTYITKFTIPHNIHNDIASGEPFNRFRTNNPNITEYKIVVSKRSEFMNRQIPISIITPLDIYIKKNNITFPL